MNFNERMIDPKSPDRRPRRAAYALPTFFTAGNIFLGYLSVIQSFQGAMLASGTGVGAEPHFEIRRQKAHLIALRFHQHVGQDRDRVFPLDDSLEKLQFSQ